VKRVAQVLAPKEPDSWSGAQQDPALTKCVMELVGVRT
jgi:hypothetical protein